MFERKFYTYPETGARVTFHSMLETHPWYNSGADCWDGMGTFLPSHSCCGTVTQTLDLGPATVYYDLSNFMSPFHLEFRQ